MTSRFTAEVHQNEYLPPGGTDVTAILTVTTVGSGPGGDTWLRLWTPSRATVASLRQLTPTIADLIDLGRTLDPHTREYPTGPWGEESRDFHLRICVAPRELGEEMLAGRVSLAEDGDVHGHGLIRAIWTGDDRRSTAINPTVARHTGPGGLDAATGSEEVDTSTTARREPCPRCRAPRSGDDRFCEGCGHVFERARA